MTEKPLIAEENSTLSLLYGLRLTVTVKMRMKILLKE